MALDELRAEPVGFARGGAVPDRHQFHPMLTGKPRQLSNRLVPTTLWLMRVDRRGRRDLSGPGDHGDFDAGPIPRIKMVWAGGEEMAPSSDGRPRGPRAAGRV